MIPGYVFKRISFFDGPDFLNLPVLQLLRYPLTLLWLVGVTSAVNFIDGVDGLAGGISLLAALTFGVVFSSMGLGGATPLLCTCLAAAVLGFLVYNFPFPKAKIFMGDGGAYFLGFTLALLPLVETGDPDLSLPVPYAAAILMIPILDTTAAVWRRLRDHRRIDSPDQAHTHHKLINLGLSYAQLDLVFFALQAVLGALVFFAVRAPGYRSLLILFLAYVVGAAFFTVIHFLNRRKLRAFYAAAVSPPGRS
jgi:UDP-GlcNAc:undecaprenyl-phosphate GlcNAc-1-phosphate transferase